jgi:pyrroloquinoline quinone biosynthesis protein E
VSESAVTVERPYTLVAELSYRCPLRCLYCSNPVTLPRRAGAVSPATSAAQAAAGLPELSAADWSRAIREAAGLGVLQLHLTGGEPLVREDLAEIAASGRAAGLYVNLITSGVGLTEARLSELKAAGLDAVQLSFQDSDPSIAAVTSGADAHSAKLRAAALIRSAGLPLTVNVVMHRANLARTAQIVALAEALGAHRVELANAQYLGWALANRDALMPSREALAEARRVAAEAKARLAGRMEVLFVLPDYHADRPRACMEGWARRYIVIAPDGSVLPCQAAATLPHLVFDNVKTASLPDIWSGSAALNAYRGEAWMSPTCRACDKRAVDFGGCRCQAFHLTGDAAATDPACSLSPRHSLVEAARLREPAPPVYRRVPSPA